MNDYSISLESPVWHRKPFCNSKYDDRMEKVDLLNANRGHSTIQFDDGHKSIISTKELAPYSNNGQESKDGEISHLSPNNNAPQDYEKEETEDETHAGTDELSLESPTAIQQPRRSSRI
ncbi:hypothetical protein ACOME3_007883 [Neoechinorhynchus agilis]